MIKHICTVSDKKYIQQGLGLLHSLKKSSVKYQVHYLCLDSETVDRMSKEPNVITYTPEHILPEFLKTDYKYYACSGAALFSYYLLKNNPIDSILYCDVDIFFHRDVSELYTSLFGSNVGIFRHRCFTPSMNRSEGMYNVGVVYFNRKGFEISEWWADAVTYKKYKPLSTCYDQKYLDAFPILTDKLCDDCVGHAAPWNWYLYDLSQLDDHKIFYNGVWQNLIFTHFSQFKIVDSDTYIASTAHQSYTRNDKIFEEPPLKRLYNNYFNLIKDL